jgi:hypothetical protein
MPDEEILEHLLTAHLLLGAVNLRGQWRLFAGSVGEWTLDYPACDPGWEPSENERLEFRSGLLVVDVHNADEFCAAMQPYEVTTKTLVGWMQRVGQAAIPLTFVVDFDRRLFVHGYDEPIEPRGQYIPPSWTGIVDDPLDHVPAEIKDLWT